MALETVEDGLPEELESQLLPKEEVHYFSYISYNGGCFNSSSRDEYWISLTNKRVIYHANVIEKEGNKTKTVEKHGILPLEKVSFVEVTDEKESDGCSTSHHYELRISTSGGTVHIPIPAKEKGIEIRAVYSEIIDTHYSKTKSHSKISSNSDD